MQGSSRLMKSTTGMISIRLIAHTEGEVVDTAAEIITSAREAMDMVTAVNSLPFVDQDHEEATVEVDGAIKGPAKGDAISVDDQDAGRSTILGKNKNNPLTTSASNTSLQQAEQPPRRTSKCSSAILKAQRR
ncbi:hypothetical protein GB937_010728 [Aspergillus fischeri]|nr:hypothetical protein GB937_010728 [Aspergillus fischeri]